MMPRSAHEFSILKQLAGSRPQVRECCELCAAELLSGHDHLLDPGKRRVLCACQACAVLFGYQSGARFRRIPKRLRLLAEFRVMHGQWESLGIPISLAFFFRQGDSGRVVAHYPSPGGIIESLLPLDCWTELENANPALTRMEPDVEVLLVNRLVEPHRYLLAPIDEAYRLVGLIRTHWSGISGGPEVWNRVAAFFDELSSRAVPS
jgi:Family of unknown function (DUF5947)